MDLTVLNINQTNPNNLHVKGVFSQSSTVVDASNNVLYKLPVESPYAGGNVLVSDASNNLSFSRNYGNTYASVCSTNAGTMLASTTALFGMNGNQYSNNIQLTVNPTTNAFTILDTGLYRIDASVQYAEFNGTNVGAIIIFRNGISETQVLQPTQGTDSASATSCLSVIVQLVQNDFISFGYRNFSTQTRPYWNTNFVIVRIG